MDTRTKETIRYLGYRSRAVDEQTFALIEESFTELDEIAEQRIIYRLFRVIPGEGDDLCIGQMHVTSKNLKQNLRHCDQAIVLGATLGPRVDLALRRYQVTDMARAVVMQAASAAMLEEFLDRTEEKLRGRTEFQGKSFRPRFSPGYGDFDIRHQDMILRMLNAGKTIGLAMTDSFMLTPSKSVTALIGVTDGEENCEPSGCEACVKKDCEYRRNR